MMFPRPEAPARPASPARQGDVRLATARLLLRPPAMTDVDAIVAGIGDWEVARMLAKVPHPYSRSDGASWVERTVAAVDGASLLIEHEGAVAGCVGVQPGKRGFILGYWLARPAWGQGIATEAGGALLAYAFGTLRYAAVHSGVLYDNAASLRVQEKLGFEVTGTSQLFCLARNTTVAHIDTVLTAARHAERASAAAGLDAGVLPGAR